MTMMKMMKNEKDIDGYKRILMDILALIVMLGAIVGLWYNYQAITSEGNQCRQSPLTYGVKALEKANEAPLMCRCTLFKPNTPTLIVTSSNLTFDSDSGVETRMRLPQNWTLNP